MKLFRKWLNLILLILIICAGCSDANPSLPGYIEGEYTYISSGVSGNLLQLHVERGQQVQKDDILYELDPQPEKADVGATQANITDLQAQVDFAKLEWERQKKLYPVATTKEAVDQTAKEFYSKKGQLSALQAVLARYEWALQQKTIYAPVSGEVFDTFYEIGERVQLNQPVLAILTPENIKVQFYIPERSLSTIKLGQTISFSCDGCKGKTTAKVNYISPTAQYTPPVIYSKDTRYKLVYLIRAVMPENIAKNFHPGQPIEVYLHP